MTTPTTTRHEAQAQTKVARAELVKRVLIVVTAFLVAICLGLLIFLSYQVRASQVSGESIRQRILDCTDPKGECYQQSQRRTAKAVGDIGAGNILAVVCALQVPNGTPLNQALQQVTDCVAARLKATKVNPNEETP